MWKSVFTKLEMYLVRSTQNSTKLCRVTKNSYLLLQHSMFTFTTKHENVTIDIYFYNKNLRDSTVYFYNKLERIIGRDMALYSNCLYKVSLIKNLLKEVRLQLQEICRGTIAIGG